MPALSRKKILLGLAGIFVGLSIGVFFTGKNNGKTDAGPEKEAEMSEFAVQEKSLRQVAADNPGDHKAWARLGHLYFDFDVYPKAIDAYKKALDLKPDDADILTDLGTMFRYNGDPQKAVDSFDRAMTAVPGHQPAMFSKGVVLMYDLKNKQAALQIWEKLLEINPVFMADDSLSLDQLIQHHRTH